MPTKEKIKQVEKSEIWRRLHLHETNESTYNEEFRKAVTRCKNSKPLNELLNEIINAAVSSGMEQDKARAMIKELCSEFVTIVYLMPQATDEELIAGFCKSLLESEKEITINK